MHYLVQRWHTGKRLGTATILTHGRRKNNTKTNYQFQQQTVFHLGQPVSSQNFINPHQKSSILHHNNDELIYNFNNDIINQAVPSTSNRRCAFDLRTTSPSKSNN